MDFNSHDNHGYETQEISLNVKHTEVSILDDPHKLQNNSIPGICEKESGEKLITWEPYGKMTKKQFNKKVWRNIIIISISIMCNYSAYGCLSSLQSSLHIQDGMGTVCKSIRYMALVLSCVFVPNIMIRLISHKWTIMVCFIGFLIWEAANGYGVWATMVPASIINGFFVAPLWAAQGSYFTGISREYAKVNKENEETRIAVFFGIYYAFVSGADFFGNLISSTILNSSPPENYTAPSDEDIAYLCGMEDCPWKTVNNTNLEKPPDSVVWTLVGVCMMIGLAAVLIMIFLVDHLPRHLVRQSDLTIKEEFGTYMMSTIRHTMQWKQVFIIPITVYIGLQESFFGAEFNRSWVTCTLGIWMIGFIGIPFGLAGSVVSFTGGRLVKVIGRTPIFVTGLCIDFMLQIFLSLWTVDQNKVGVFYTVSTLWGTTDAIWVFLVGTTYGIFFPDDSEAAFSNHILWVCVGYAVGFSYSSVLCTSVKLYILFSMLWIGIACYLVGEYIHHKYNDHKNIENDEQNVKNIVELSVQQLRYRSTSD